MTLEFTLCSRIDPTTTESQPALEDHDIDYDPSCQTSRNGQLGPITPRCGLHSLGRWQRISTATLSFCSTQVEPVGNPGLRYAPHNAMHGKLVR